MFVEWTELDSHMVSWNTSQQEDEARESFEETSGWMKEAGTGQEI
jgi:hypothetical protein